jgi:hypothetical protein
VDDGVVWKSGKRGLLPETCDDVGDGWISDSILGVLASDMVGELLERGACSVSHVQLRHR